MSNPHHKSCRCLKPPSNLPPAPLRIPPGRAKTTVELIFVIFISLGTRRAQCKIIVNDGSWFDYEIFKIVLPTRARSTFFKTCDAKSELEHKNHERGILKLALLMQVRIMIQR